MNASANAVPSEIRRLRPAMGTLVEVSTTGDAEAVAAAFAAIEAVESEASFFRADSDLSRLNRATAGAELAIGAHLAALLELATLFERRSAGAFNANLGALRTSSAAGGAHALAVECLELLPGGRVRVRRPVSLDLGGLAKGYAVDRAIEALKRAGASAGSVNAGGDLAVFGRCERIAIRAPEDWRQPARTVELEDAALATSAGYAEDGPFHGRAGLAIYDRDGNLPARAAASVTVVAPLCAMADALTKVLWVERRQGGAACDHPLLAEFGASALWMERDMLGEHGSGR
jgi:thiamine biosynthesis lipoprotein